MTTKLTLSIDKDIIEQAKKYAQANNTSLSSLIENYLARFSTIKSKTEIEITPLVKSLSGVLSVEDLENSKEKYLDYLENKYK